MPQWREQTEWWDQRMGMCAVCCRLRSEIREADGPLNPESSTMADPKNFSLHFLKGV